jgi:hypothetical protein
VRTIFTIHNGKMHMMYNNQPNDPSRPPTNQGTFPSPLMPQYTNNPMSQPPFNDQNTFAQFPSPYQQPPQEPVILPAQERQPDLQRFNKKQRGSMTSRLASLQTLRQQVQQQGLPTRNSNKSATTQGSVVDWYKSLGNDMKIALASIGLLLFLLLSVGVFALAGGFQDAQGQASPNTSPANNPNAPVATATSGSTATATSTPTPTATPQASPTITDMTTPPANQQPIDVPTPADTPVPTPADTPVPTPTTVPTVVATPTTIPVPTVTPPAK